MNLENLAIHYESTIKEVTYQLLKRFIELSEKIFDSTTTISKVGFMIDSDSDDYSIKSRPLYILIEKYNNPGLPIVFMYSNQSFYEKTFKLELKDNEKLSEAFNELFFYETLPSKEMYHLLVNFVDKRKNSTYHIDKDNLSQSTLNLLGEEFSIRYEKECLEKKINTIQLTKNHKTKV
jgi:hypothetical protein